MIARIKSSNSQSEFIWKSDAIEMIMRNISSIAKTDANVIIIGESGTGKELVAKIIYSNSLRGKHNFVPINCASLPENLLESELFGHEKGAFSGAFSKKKGLFEYADQGTVFLDEVSEMSQYMQAKLLRFLEDGSFRRVGSTELLHADARILSAINLSPQEAVREGKLRLDLYHRLSMTKIEIPPLRERTQDICEIINFYFKKIAEQNGKRIDGINADALNVLMEYNWPGNVRELRNVVYQLTYLCQGSNITLEDLRSINFQISPSIYEETGVVRYKSEKERIIFDFHRDYFGFLIKKFNGNLSKVAQMAGISRTALYQILDRANLDNSAKSDQR